MTRLQHRSRKTVTLIVAGGLTLAGTGVAFAYWTAIGHGEGTASTGQLVPFEITSEGPVGKALTPGGSAQTVAFTVTNPSAETQNLSEVGVYVGKADGSSWSTPYSPYGGECSGADFTAVITSTARSLPTQVVGGADVTGVATITMVNRNTDQNACQNQSPPLYFFTLAKTA